jgi:hypothetical protein
LKVSQSSQSSCKIEFTCYLTHLSMERGSNLVRVYSLKSYSLAASYVTPSKWLPKHSYSLTSWTESYVGSLITCWYSGTICLKWVLAGGSTIVIVWQPVTH